AGCLALLAGLYATSGITAINSGEVGLVQRFGGYRGLLEPGLHLRFPAPIEHVTRLEPARVRSLLLGFARTGQGGGELLRWENSHGRSSISTQEDEADGLLLTGDGQFLELSASLQY